MVERLNLAFTQALGDGSVAKSFAALGIGAATETRAQFAAGLRPEAAQCTEIKELIDSQIIQLDRGD